MLRNVLLVLLFVGVALLVRADESNHQYQYGDVVQVYTAQIGPKHNPQETYHYYDFPFCPPKNVETSSITLGQAIQGFVFTKSNFDLRFKTPKLNALLCNQAITEENSKTFLLMVEQEYWYQFYIDDLPTWEVVGGIAVDITTDKKIPYVFAHKTFSIGYNKDRIVEVKVIANNKIPIKVGNNIPFTYSVEWYESKTTYAGRFLKYLELDFFEHKIHWFSIFNSFMMVLFLVGLVFILLLRTLRSDIAKSNKSDIESSSSTGSSVVEIDETGWKQLHGDVFRAPSLLGLFANLLGTGSQLASLILITIIYATIFNFYDNRGTLLTVFIVLYSVTSFISGYVSGSYYLKHKGQNWIRTMFFTALLFPLLCAVIGSSMIIISSFYGSNTLAFSFKNIAIVVSLWSFVNLPLVFIGTVAGRNISGKGDFPCRIHPMPRHIPAKPWYLNRLLFFIVGGLLPFGSIFIEIYFIYTSFWTYKFYYVYGFMFLIYLILFIVCMCISIVATYFQLNAEDYRWPWTSFTTSASTGIYVFLYSIYFYFFKTNMFGLFQFSYYFASTFLFSVITALITGVFGYFGTSTFVRKIYSNVKLD